MTGASTQTSPDRRRKVARWLTECWLPLLAIGGYATAFALNVRDMEPRESGYPIALATLLVGLGVWHAVGALRTVKVETPDDTIVEALASWFARWRKALIAAGLTLGYFLALRPMDFYVATFVYLLVTPWALGTRRLVLALGTATAFTGVCYLIFSIVLDIRLP